MIRCTQADLDDTSTLDDGYASIGLRVERVPVHDVYEAWWLRVEEQTFLFVATPCQTKSSGRPRTACR